MKMFKNYAILALIAVLPACNGCSSHNQELKLKLKTYLDKHAATGQFMGSVVVRKYGEDLFSGGYGWENVKAGIQNTTQTKFWLESVSKNITALAVIQLCERGLLNLDDPIVKYLPADYPTQDRSNVEKDGVAVTIRHLLEHKSGIQEYDTSQYVNSDSQVLNIKSIDEYLSLIKSIPLQFVPGSEYEYSNTGYNLLACIITKVYGKGYDVYLKENIFDPLGMKNSGCARICKPGPGFAVGYDFDFIDKNYLELPGDNIDFPVGSGNIYSTVEDMTLWNEAIFSDKLLRDWTPVLPFLSLNEAFGYKCFGAFGAGEGDGFRTFSARFVDSENRVRASIVILSNCGATEFFRMSRDLSIMVFGVEEPAPVIPKIAVTLSEGELIKCLGSYKKPDGGVCKIYREPGNKLYIVLPFEGQAPDMRIFAETSTELFLQQFPEQKISLIDVDGEIRLVIHPGLFGDEEDVVAVKISE